MEASPIDLRQGLPYNLLTHATSYFHQGVTMSGKQLVSLAAFVLTILFASIALSEETGLTVLKGEFKPMGNESTDPKDMAYETLQEMSKASIEDRKKAQEMNEQVHKEKMGKLKDAKKHAEESHANENKKSVGQGTAAAVGTGAVTGVGAGVRAAGKRNVSQKALRNESKVQKRERFKREKPRKPERSRGKR
jgi:hypothetical protein